MALISNSFYRFCGLAGVGFLLNISLAFLNHEIIGIDEKSSVALALAMVFIINFILNRYVVFQSREKSIKQQLLYFFISSATFRCFEFLLFYMIFTFVYGQYLLVYIGVLAISFCIKYFFLKAYIFS